MCTEVFMKKKIVYGILAMFTIIFSLWYLIQYANSVAFASRSYFNGDTNKTFLQFFSQFLGLFVVFAGAIFWSIIGIINTFKSETQDLLVDFSALVEEKKEKREKKRKERNNSRIAKMKSKIEKIESDE